MIQRIPCVGRHLPPHAFGCELIGLKCFKRFEKRRFYSGGSRVDSSDGLRWHNDRTDVVALLCVRKAETGGVSRIVSAVAIHDAMQARRPDLLALLYRDYYRSTVGVEVGAETPFYPLPVFALCQGHFTSNFSKTYIEQAQRLPDVPRLTDAQWEAVDLVIDLAEELCFEMPLELSLLEIFGTVRSDHNAHESP